MRRRIKIDYDLSQKPMLRIDNVIITCKELISESRLGINEIKIENKSARPVNVSYSYLISGKEVKKMKIINPTMRFKTSFLESIKVIHFEIIFDGESE